MPSMLHSSLSRATLSRQVRMTEAESQPPVSRYQRACFGQFESANLVLRAAR